MANINTEINSINSAVRGEEVRDSIVDALVKINSDTDGNMKVAVYDTDADGIVDNAEKVNGHTVGVDVPSNAVFTDTTYSEATTSSSGLMSSSDKVKVNKLPSVTSSDNGKFIVVDSNGNLTAQAISNAEGVGF